MCIKHILCPMAMWLDVVRLFAEDDLKLEVNVLCVFSEVSMYKCKICNLSVEEHYIEQHLNWNKN